MLRLRNAACHAKLTSRSAPVRAKGTGWQDRPQPVPHPLRVFRPSGVVTKEAFSPPETPKTRRGSLFFAISIPLQLTFSRLHSFCLHFSCAQDNNSVSVRISEAPSLLTTFPHPTLQQTMAKLNPSHRSRSFALLRQSRGFERVAPEAAPAQGMGGGGKIGPPEIHVGVVLLGPLCQFLGGEQSQMVSRLPFSLLGTDFDCGKLKRPV